MSSEGKRADLDVASSVAPSRTVLSAKRIIDIIVSLVALSILAIPMMVVAVAIRMYDSGPALYRQSRVGRGAIPFQMLKFRSMLVDADVRGGFTTSVNDQRITALGRFIRRTSIDELPQLINVLRGDMSIVGPRPDVPAQEKLYLPAEWKARHMVRPGITGLAQAQLRSEASAEERTDLDIRYIENLSLIGDWKILIMTAAQLFKKTGN